MGTAGCAADDVGVGECDGEGEDAYAMAVHGLVVVADEAAGFCGLDTEDFVQHAGQGVEEVLIGVDRPSGQSPRWRFFGTGEGIDEEGLAAVLDQSGGGQVVDTFLARTGEPGRQGVPVMSRGSPRDGVGWDVEHALVGCSAAGFQEIRYIEPFSVTDSYRA
jgi:hypothetical protein